ncbi:CAP domain-containing protein [Pontibacter harenae]|uniref:CAP domain-containing protein n=1 Tax=Pontibacter harenae TaxID=2894083 RepID=UPI001E40D043|nr:CAP domain-containing protein [Pontibacter harenae]MCC9168023.1 CAP domain-containing protein [Pontibacter harenae]
MPFLFKYTILLLMAWWPIKQEQSTTDILQAVAEASFKELNAVRQDPKHYAGKYKLPALLKVPAKHELVWDTTLARLAQQKAEDMARKNYFDHVDKKGKGMNYYLWQANYPLPHYFSKDAKANNVESIAANTQGPQEFIKQLIIDAGVPSLGHQKHLLGLNDKDTPTTHVGIGIAYNPRSKYKYYCSILIVPKAENL